MAKDSASTTYDDVLDALDHCIQTVDNADVRNRLRIAQRLLGSKAAVARAAAQVAQDGDWELDEDELGTATYLYWLESPDSKYVSGPYYSWEDADSDRRSSELSIREEVIY